MKYIKYFKESSEYDELKEQVELYIVDLIDKGFQVFCEVDQNETYDYIDITIRPPYDSYKSYDEQEYFYWDDVKDNIIVLSKVLEKDYDISEIGIHLAVFDKPLIIEDLDDLEDLEDFIKRTYSHSYLGHRRLNGIHLSRVVLYLIKNK